MSCLLIIVCLFVFCQVGTLQVGTCTYGYPNSIYSCITVPYSGFFFFLFLFGSLSLFSGFVLPRHSFARPTTTTEITF